MADDNYSNTEGPLRPRQAERLLRPAEAGKRLSVSRQWFYDHEKEAPFIVRLPGGGALRISERKLEEWLEEGGRYR